MKARGFVLLPVLCFVLVIAILAYGAAREGPLAVAREGRAEDAVAVRYAAEAGLAHASWAAEQSDCGTYDDLSQGFGAGTYAVLYSASTGSPVTLTSTASSSSGASYTLARTIAVYRLPVSMENQPGVQNADTFIRKGDNNGQGTNKKLEVWSKGSDEARSLLQVDLSSLPAGARVVSAVLQIKVDAVHITNGAAELTAHRITRAWSETNATWNNYDVLLLLGQPWSSGGGDHDPIPAARLPLPDESKNWKNIDLTVLVQKWLAGEAPNYGVLLKANSAVDDFKFFSSDETSANRPNVILQYVCECGTTCAPVEPVGTTLVLSTVEDSTLGGISFKDGDVVRYDPVAGTATTILIESTLFGTDEDIDALHVYEGDRVVLSTETAASVAGLAFQDEDLVEYSPSAGVAVLVFDGSAHFASDEDVDAAYLYDDGRIVLLTETGANLAGLGFQDDDLVEYDPSTNAPTLIFDGAVHFANDENIDAVQMLDDGRYLLSADSDATLAGLSFTDADVVLYDPLKDTAVKVLDGSGVTAAADTDVDAVHDFRPHPLTDELRLEPIADTHISNATPATNFGGSPTLFVANNLRVLLRFDLSALPIGATVTSAKLYLNLGASGSGLILGAYRVTADWAEGAATWSNTGGGSFDALPLATASFSPATAKWVVWSLPPGLIQEWRDGVTPNYGVLLKPTVLALATVTARSRNHSSAAAHPRLVLDYTLP